MTFAAAPVHSFTSIGAHPASYPPLLTTVLLRAAIIGVVRPHSPNSGLKFAISDAPLNEALSQRTGDIVALTAITASTLFYR